MFEMDKRIFSKGEVGKERSCLRTRDRLTSEQSRMGDLQLQSRTKRRWYTIKIRGMLLVWTVNRTMIKPGKRERTGTGDVTLTVGTVFRSSLKRLWLAKQFKIGV